MKDYRAIYRQLNESFTGKTLIYRVGIDAGFFTELRYMAAAMLWCLAHEVRFELYGDNANFGSWDEFFEPFCPERHESWHATLNRRAVPSFTSMRSREGRVHVPLWRFAKWKCKTWLSGVVGSWHGHCLLSQHLPTDPLEHYDIPQLDINGPWRDGLCRMLEVMWHPRTLVHFDVPAIYCGCQLRGGDKDTEMNLLLPADVVRMLPADVPDVVVLTDDYRLLEQVRSEFPERRFHSLCQPSERGYVHSAFASRTGQDKHAQMLRFLTTMDTLMRATCYAGSVSSAPSLLMLAWHHTHHDGALPVDNYLNSTPPIQRMELGRNKP